MNAPIAPKFFTRPRRSLPPKTLEAAARWAVRHMSDDYQQQLLADVCTLNAAVIAPRLGNPRLEEAARKATGKPLSDLLERLLAFALTEPKDAPPPPVPLLDFTQAEMRHAWRRADRLRKRIGDSQFEQAGARVRTAAATAFYAYVAAPSAFFHSDPALPLGPEREARTVRLGDWLAYFMRGELRDRNGETVAQKVRSHVFNGSGE